VPPEEVPEFVREHWAPTRFAPERSARLRACFSAHLRAWEALAAEGSPGAIVLEDDALLLRPIPDLPNALTLLGGVFCGHARRWTDIAPWVSSGEFVEALEALEVGVRELPVRDGVRMKWYMSVAYYVPPGMAQRLVDAVYAAKTKTLRCPDAWLNRFATHFAWPPPFGDQGSESQCLTSPDYHDSDFYCNTRMFRAARRLGLMDRLSRVLASASGPAALQPGSLALLAGREPEGDAAALLPGPGPGREGGHELQDVEQDVEHLL
jgi:hypothetical protein